MNLALSGQRSQLIGKLKIGKSILSHGTYTFYFDTVLKATKPGNHKQPLVFNTDPQNSKLPITFFLSKKSFSERLIFIKSQLSVFDCLQEYRSRTNLGRESLY